MRGAVRGRLGRERGDSRPAFDRARPWVLAGGSTVGGYGLRAVLCGLLAPVREGSGPVGQEEDLRRGAGLVHGGFALLWALGVPGDAGDVACSSGAWGGDHRSSGA